MAESLTLATPIITPAITLSDYRVIYLSLDWDIAQIIIKLRGTNGENQIFVYGGLTATQSERNDTLALMVALNKANLSTNSLHKRILNKLVTDGKLSGTVTGTPD